MAGSGGIGLSGIRFIISGDPSPLVGALRKAREEVSDTAWMGDMASAVMNATKMYAMATGAAAVAMVAPFYVAMNATSEYNDNMTRAVAVGGDTFAEHWDDMAAKITDLATTYGVTANDTSQALTTLTKAGFSYEEIMGGKIVDTVAMLAAANQTTVQESAQIINTAMHLWEGSAGDMADKIQAAANASMLDVQDLGYAFRYSGAAASAASIGIDEYLAAIAAISQIGVEGGESMSTLFTKIFADTSSSLNDVLNAQIRDELTGAIDMNALMTALMGIDESGMEQMFEIYNMDSMGLRPAKNLNYLRIVAEEYFEILEDVQESEGILEKAAATMANSLPALKNRIIGAITAPLWTEDVQKELSGALTKILEMALSNDVSTRIKEIVIMSARFVQEMAPMILDTVQRLMAFFVNNKDTISGYARQLFILLDFLSKIPPAAANFLISFYMIARVMRDVRDVMISMSTSGAIAGILRNFATVRTAVTGTTAPVLTVDNLYSSQWAKSPKVIGMIQQLAPANAELAAQQATFLQMQTSQASKEAALAGMLRARATSLENANSVEVLAATTKSQAAQSSLASSGVFDVAARNSMSAAEQEVTAARLRQEAASMSAAGSPSNYISNAALSDSLKSQGITVVPSTPRTPGYMGIEYGGDETKYYSNPLSYVPNQGVNYAANKDVGLRELTFSTAPINRGETAFGDFAATVRNGSKSVKAFGVDVAVSESKVKGLTNSVIENNDALGRQNAQVKTTATTMAQGFSAAAMSIVGVVSGISLMASTTDPLVRGIGALITAVMAFNAVLTITKTLASPKSWLAGPEAILLALGAAAAVTAGSYILLGNIKSTGNVIGGEGVSGGTVNRHVGEEEDTGEDMVYDDETEMAVGGVVKARPGGVRALIGEAGYDEAVIPLNASVLRSIPTLVTGKAAEGSVYNYDNRVINNYYPEPISIWYKTSARYGV